MKLLPAHQTFIAECRDLLAAMEDALLQLEHEPDNTEAINAVFRAAHTIKGSAGVFGFDAIVAFTHVMESLLEEIRAGSVVIDGDMIALLLLCADHVSNMIAQTTSEGQIVDAETRVTDVALIARLQVYLDLPAPALPALAEPGVAKVESSGGNVSSDTWHISLRFGRDVLRHGMDPLETLGEMANVATLCDTMPDADNMNPESCYLGLEMDFRGAVDKKTIEGAFDFVRDDCAIRILPPHSKIADYILLINELPEDKSRLGELLITSGALTERELEEGLLMQEETKARGGMTPSVEDPRKIGEILARQGVVQHELVDAALEKQRVVKEHRALENSFMRVRADKLDELITLVGELVIAGAGTRLLAQRAGDSELIESSLTLEGLVEQIRDGALKLRMVPIGDTFNRFNRVVRDLGRDMG
jgi:two-component system chemotaxis sensor kinase CheA